MGIKKRNVVYVSDRGDEFELDQMEPSHLINVLKHHRAQRECLENIIEMRGLAKSHTHLGTRIKRLIETENALIDELMRRDPDEDDDEEGVYSRPFTRHTDGY